MEAERADVMPSSPPLSEPGPLLSPISSWSGTMTPASCSCFFLWPESLETLESQELHLIHREKPITMLPFVYTVIAAVLRFVHAT